MILSTRRIVCCVWFGLWCALAFGGCYAPLICQQDSQCETGFHCAPSSQQCIQTCKHKSQCQQRESCDLARGRCIAEIVCAPQVSRACIDGHMQWFDSCGAIGARAEDCGTRGCTETSCRASRCGDGTCDQNTSSQENCETCPQDCGCVLPEICEPSTRVCRTPTTPKCGDGTCTPETQETCDNCPQDCACDPMTGQRCIAEICQTPCTDGQPCQLTSGEGICRESVCIPQLNCQSNQDCTNNQACLQGLCAPCQKAEDCGLGECNKGSCRLALVPYKGSLRWSDESAAPNCQGYLTPSTNAAPATKDGTYWIAPPNTAAFQVYCLMTHEGGGWTLALKADGRRATFQYDTSLWTNKDTYKADNFDLDLNEAKLTSFSTVPVKEILFGLHDFRNKQTKFVPVGIQATSLQTLFQAKKYTPVTKKAKHQAWRDLLSDSSLLSNCNEQGINYITSDTRGSSIVGKLRFGLISNNETDCATPDAFLGMGSHMFLQSGVATTGNYAGNKGGDRGLKNTPAFGYLFVR